MIKLQLLIEQNEKMARLDRVADELFQLWRKMPEGDRKEKLKQRIDAIGRKRDRIRDYDEYEGDKHAFMKHHYTGHIPSNAYDRYEKEGGLSWLGDKSKYPILLSSGKFKDFDVEFRQSGERLKYTKQVNGEHVRDANNEIVLMSPEEIKAEGLPEFCTTIVAFVNDKPVGLASNEFGAVGVWVEGPYQKSGIGTELLDLHIQQRPTFKTKQGKIGQMTIAGQSLTAKYYDRMVARHGKGWFKKLKISESHDYNPAWDYSVDARPLKAVKKLVDYILRDTVQLQKALGFSKVSVAYIVNDGRGGLARYIAGTMDNPYIVISTRTLASAAKRYGVNLGTAVETTIVHEFGHAYLEMCGIDTAEHDENIVEDFAREFDDSRDVKKCVAILDNYVKDKDTQ